jgi:hypothetical protein
VEYCIRLKRLETNKNPDENPDLPQMFYIEKKSVKPKD